MAVTELEINGIDIQLISKVSELENDATYQSKTQVEDIVNNAIDQITAEDISTNDGNNVQEELDFVKTKEQTISDPNNTISLSTKITNIILNNGNNTNISFSYSGQNECTIVIYNQTGNSITLPTNFSNIGNYEVISVNGISSVTLLNGSSCEINMLFTNNECRMLILI